jgi:23S rRNA (cytosine1962-C5)-methyltransferase
MHKIFLKPGKDEPVRRFHPWVFSGAIGRVEGAPADGDLVAVHDRQGDLLGVGHFHDGSIAVRLLGFGEVHPEEPAFWIAKIRTALSVRRAAGLPSDVSHTNCYRLLRGDGGLSKNLRLFWGTL